MYFSKPSADVYVPDGSPNESAFKRTTHLSIAAHPDDNEMLAYDGILQCFNSTDLWFSSVTVTNGNTAPRDFEYANYSNEQMRITRLWEQKKAAMVGNYSAAIQLDYTSPEVRDQNSSVVADLEKLFQLMQPKVVYTHNLADKHDTHIAVTLRLIKALRSIPLERQPEKLYGCEIWRDLDWLVDEDKVAFDVSGHPNIATSLIGLYDTQILGSKRYDIAVPGRRSAQAIYHESHGTGGATQMIFAMDLTPLVRNPDLNPVEYTITFIDHFKQDVSDRINRFL
jgi:LmbE family N-acetylglucosaminyl deacetylase